RASAALPPSPRRVSTDRPAVPDEQYLDGRDPNLLRRWVASDDRARQAEAWLKRRLPPMKDDFVHVPLPRVAFAGPGQAALLASAIHAYEKEAKVVDARLFRKVTLQLKGAALEDFCAALETQTGVRLR